MSTKVEQFTLKLGYLKGCLTRLESNKIVATSDYSTIISLMRYFKQVILTTQSEKFSNTGWLIWPLLCKNEINQNESFVEYLSSYPAFPYSTLYELTLSVLQCITFIPDSRDVCISLLEMLCHTLPFMEEEVRLELSLQVASLLPEGDFEFHGLIIDALSDSIIPMSLVTSANSENKAFISAIVSAIITILFEFVTDATLHMKLIEAFMIFKSDLWKDMLMVVAYGSEPVKICAVKYLFHYWPNLYTQGMANHVIPATSLPAVMSCENRSCKSKHDIVATTALFDPVLSAYHGWKNAPLYLCDACKNDSMSAATATSFYGIYLRKEIISYFCENKNCFSRDKTAVVTICGNSLCDTVDNNDKVLTKHRCRYCDECYNNIEKHFGEKQLLTQNSPTIFWDLNKSEDKTVMVDAIVSLLRNAGPSLYTSQSCEDRDDGGRTSYFYLSMIDGTDASVVSGDLANDPVHFHYLCKTCIDNLWNTNGGAQCQFGIWLLIVLCPIQKNIPVGEGHLKSLLSSTIQWCSDTTYLPGDELGGKLENLKYELMRGWMTDISTMYFKTFNSYLLPRTRMEDTDTEWESSCPEWKYHYNGLSLILCLASYSIIKKETWNKIIPPWIELLDNEFENIKEIPSLKEVLAKLFAVDISPLPFESKYIFKFVTRLFEDADEKKQLKGLSWLQTLTEMEIIVPIETLLQIFHDGAGHVMDSSQDHVTKSESNNSLDVDDVDDSVFEDAERFTNVSECSTSMLYVLHKQMELQEISPEDMKFLDWMDSLFEMFLKHLKWICSEELECQQNLGSSTETCGGNRDAKTNNHEKLLIIWFRKAQDILQLVLPQTVKNKSRNSIVSMEPGKTTNDAFTEVATKLVCELTDILSKQDDPLMQYITLQIIQQLCDAYPIYTYSNTLSQSTSKQPEKNNFCIKFFHLWTNLTPGCQDMFQCATSILLDSLMVSEIAESFITRINFLLVSTDWIVRYETINRIQHLLDSVQQQHIQKRSSFTRVITSCFCLILSMMDDEKLEVQIKCTHVIENISMARLKNVCSCLELEFTAVPQKRAELLLHMQIINRLRPQLNLFAVFYSACMGYVVRRGRYGHEQDGLGGYAVQQNLTSDLSMAHEIVHLLIHVICKNIIEFPSRVKSLSETKCFQSMMRNFFIHFGYNDQIGYFMLKPTEVRKSIGFSSFMLNLPKVLDSNQNLGTSFLPTAITLLEYSTLPELNTMNSQQISHQLTLKLLPESLQESWLSSLLLILYKYDVTDHSQLMQLLQLVIVCLNTLESEIHLCPNEHTLLRFHSNTTENADPNNESHFAINSIALPPAMMSPRPQLLSRLSRPGLSTDRIDAPMHSFRNTTIRPAFQGRSSPHLSRQQTDISISAASPSVYLQMSNRSTSVDSLPARKTYSKRSSGPQLTNIEKPGTNTEESSEDDIEKRKKPSVSLSVSSQSPHRRRSPSDISREWKIITQIPLHNEVGELRCHKCNEKVFGFSSKILSASIINICYFVKCNAEMAAPLLPRILTQLVYISNLLGDGGKEKQCSNVPLKVSAISSSSNVYSCVAKVARQSIRCILQQLTSNLLLTKIFLLPLEDPSFLHGLALCLNDYQNLNSLAAVKHVIEGLPTDLKTLSALEFDCLIENLSIYMSCLTTDASSTSIQWQQVISSFSSFCNKVFGVLPFREQCNADGLFSIIAVLLKSHVPSSSKQFLLESFSKLLVVVLQKCCFTLQALYTMCCASCKVYARTKDKSFLIRYVVSELISSLKLKNKFQHENVVMLLQFILVDIGTCLNPCSYQTLNTSKFALIKMNLAPCNVLECMKPYHSDCLEIIMDLEFLNNLKEHVLSNHDQILHASVCANIKVAIAQVICMELSQSSQQEKPLQTLLPWVYETPSSVQQGTKEYVDCVTHIRQLSWLLLGTLTHIGMFYSEVNPFWQPLPVELSSHLASIVQVILTGFPSQYMESLTDPSALFYVFVFCQLWTLYCDELSYLLTTSDTGIQGGSALGWDQNPPSTLIMEFWSRVTSSVLLLLQHSSPIADLVHTHITAVMTCLQHYNSAIVFKIYSLWKVILDSKVVNSDHAGSNNSTNYKEAQLERIHSYYASGCVESQMKQDCEHFEEFNASDRCSSESNRSANKLLSIIDQIKERLAQAEISGQPADILHTV